LLLGDLEARRGGDVTDIHKKLLEDSSRRFPEDSLKIPGEGSRRFPEDSLKIP
jgi:hypothetical protein